MLSLPPLSANTCQGSLPLSDRSAAILAEVILVGEDAALVEALESQLAAEPPLVLWAVCRAGEHGIEFRSVHEVAAWFAAHTLELLQWREGAETACDLSNTDAKELGDRVATALVATRLASVLAEPDGKAVVEEARLLGLLSNADVWLAAADGDVEGVGLSLPSWVHDDRRQAAQSHVARAVELLGDNTVLETLADAVEACKKGAAEGRRRWLEAAPGLGTRLPLLTARLARLADLEERFQEVLETEKLEAMAEFAAGAGHEINNPIAVIAGRAQLFLQDEEDPERRRGLALMNAQAKRVYEMIADMRLFARPPEPHPEQTELVELVDRVVAELTPQMAEEAVSLRRTGTEGPLEIEADPTQLTVALRAMCRNSFEAIGHGGHVEIDLREADEHVEIRVIDDGPGVDDQTRRHLFDPYYSARQAGRGLGLGLSKCWRIIVTNHHGRIDVESQPGQKTVFAIVLPKGREGK